MLSGLVRRSAPRASAVNIDWTSVANKCVADESKSFIIGLKQEIAVAEAMHDKYSAVPPPIDWAAYKGFFENNPQIAQLQTKYEGAKAAVVPPIETGATMSLSSATPVSDPKDIDWERSWMSYRDLFDKPSAIAAKQAANTKAKVTTLAEREVVLKANRTTDQTTVADVFKKYPSIEQEVNDEVANHEWCTNIK